MWEEESGVWSVVTINCDPAHTNVLTNKCIDKQTQNNKIKEKGNE